ncbi:MAG: pyridoxal phosphate-dependent aminotransferase [Breznakibacter sp.]
MSEQLSLRLKQLAQSETLAMAQRSRELQAQGIDIVNLSIGEPDFNTPDHIKEAAKKAVDDNYSHYTPVPGLLPLRQSIVDKFKRDNGLDYTADQIVVSTGAKQSIANVLYSIVDDGDEVIIPAPYWVSYIEMVKLAGGVPVIIKAGLESDFKIAPWQLEEAITPRTKVFLFSSPSNPTGSLYSGEELEQLSEVLDKHPDVVAISDEIYELINYVAPHASIASCKGMKERTVVVNGMSKGYAMTGYRIGYIAAPLWIAKACTKLQGQYTSGTCAVAQVAAKAALDGGLEASAEMVEVFKQRRDLVYGLASQIEGLKVNKPTGAFYLFPDVSHFFGKSFDEKIVHDAQELSMYLLEEGHVATVSGAAFGAPECIRLSYATSNDKLTEAMKRIKDALSKLK